MKTEEQKSKSKPLTWKDFLPIILAGPMAILVKIFLFTSYHVPTASMEPTIIPGDHILVEKWVLGPRFYINDHVYRLPGVRSIRRGDILVFNVPKEDSIFRGNREVNYYNWKHSQAGSPVTEMTKDSFQFMPIPGRTPFVKRIVGLPGDIVEYKSHSILINGKLLTPLPSSHENYEIHFQRTSDFDAYKDTLYQMGEHIQMNRADQVVRGIFTRHQLDFIENDAIRIIPRYYFPDPAQIPNDFTWARALARAGHPIRIPSEGWTAEVDSAFLSQYGQILVRFEQFEGHIVDNRLFGKDHQIVKRYTFRQNYYWAMGDNRPYSVDSRSWGLIPEDHAIGITRRTFWSRQPGQGMKEGFRWNRLWERLD
ncbi:MAG TPA: signal peptidase I [Membranihabitans sp.]|nr:signal peptidase I [Membranihabitans sp.]